MRLIDADLLKKNIAKWLQGGDPQETEMVKLDDIAVSVVMEIEEQPTAYDIEKVVAELEKEKEIHTEHYNISLYKDYPEIKQRYEQIQGVIDKTIDIVRKGGVE